MDPFSSALLFGGLLNGGFGFGRSNIPSPNNVHVNIEEKHYHEEKPVDKEKQVEKPVDKEKPKKEKKKDTLVYQGELLPSKPENLGYKKNRFGNFEMTQTRFVMNIKSRLIIGVQKTDGTIRRLEPKEKLICEAWDLRYKEYPADPPAYE